MLLRRTGSSWRENEGLCLYRWQCFQNGGWGMGSRLMWVTLAKAKCMVENTSCSQKWQQCRQKDVVEHWRVTDVVVQHSMSATHPDTCLFYQIIGLKDVFIWWVSWKCINPCKGVLLEMYEIIAPQPFLKCGFFCKDLSLNISEESQIDNRVGDFLYPNNGSDSTGKTETWASHITTVVAVLQH